MRKIGKIPTKSGKLACMCIHCFVVSNDWNKTAAYRLVITYKQVIHGHKEMERVCAISFANSLLSSLLRRLVPVIKRIKLFL